MRRREKKEDGHAIDTVDSRTRAPGTAHIHTHIHTHNT